jgi:hypothetical protein
MKKILFVTLGVLAALAIFSAGVVFADVIYPASSVSADTLPYGGMMGRGGMGVIHDYVEKALAEKLKITEEAIDAAEAEGKTLYQIAADNGIAEADLPALFAEIHKTALSAAVTDGVITQAQADLMLERMTAMAQNGYGFGNCVNGGVRPMNGSGFRRGGRGGGMMGPGFGQGQQRP